MKIEDAKQAIYDDRNENNTIHLLTLYSHIEKIYEDFEKKEDYYKKQIENYERYIGQLELITEAILDAH